VKPVVESSAEIEQVGVTGSKQECVSSCYKRVSFEVLPVNEMVVTIRPAPGVAPDQTLRLW
jgi:hypothetical protein